MEKSNQATAWRSCRNEEGSVGVLVRRGSPHGWGHKHLVGRQSHPALTTVLWGCCAAWGSSPRSWACGLGFFPLKTFWFSLVSTWCKDFPFHWSSVLAQWCSKGEGYPGKEMLYRPAQSLWFRSESEQNGVLTYFSPPLTFADNVSLCISSNACFCRHVWCLVWGK